MSFVNHSIRPLIVGLTGGIGSGKTTIAAIFSALGAPVFLADDAGRKAYDDPQVCERVVELLGRRILNETSQPDRSLIAEIVFKEPDKLKSLNSIIHPFVNDAFRTWLSAMNDSIPYVIRESAIIFESGLSDEHDVLIQISAPEELRIKRVVRRNHITRESVMKRIAAQLSDSEREALCNFVIVNDGQHPLIPEVLRIHQMLSDESSQYRRNKKRR